MEMETVFLNILSWVNYLWNLCVYDIFLIRAVVGYVAVLSLPFFISLMNEKLTNKHRDYFELNELSETITESSPSSTSVSSSLFDCSICMELISPSHLFTIHPCSHVFCFSCMRNYITSKLHENIVKIRCPHENCKELLDPDECKGIIPSHVFDRWGDALCELTIGARKFYCPFQDCSLLLIHEDELNTSVKITSSECPKCHRLFCAQCRVPWHAEMVCEDYQKLRRARKNEKQEGRMLQKLAANNKWQKCPNCKIYVERTEGCKLMKCRCGCRFCYTCGAYMHAHNCNKCATKR